MLLAFRNGLGEEKIPKELLDLAKGIAFFTIAKIGFLLTGRYGTGLVVSKLADGRWSAPSAVAISGVGWGFQAGAELTNVMLILSSDFAVNTFKSRAQISVGAELGVSVGPIGRSVESEVTASNKGITHAFSYAQSKGLFLGASLEASCIISRPDVNRVFYGEKVTSTALLSGEYPPPRGARLLYKALDEILYNGNVPEDRRSVDGSVYSSGVVSSSVSSNTTTTNKITNNTRNNEKDTKTIGENDKMLTSYVDNNNSNNNNNNNNSNVNNNFDTINIIESERVKFRGDVNNESLNFDL
jgi:lipid-binding SYLF domain-containing protein